MSEEFKWYAIQTYAGSEMSVKRAIHNLIKDNGIEEQVKDIVVPTEDVIEFKNGKEKISERSLYSGYVFICLKFSVELWHKIQSLPKVGRFIGENKTGDSYVNPSFHFLVVFISNFLYILASLMMPTVNQQITHIYHPP